MKTRAVLAVVLGNLVALLLLAVAGFVTVKLTPWGRWATDLSNSSAAQLATKYGDPVLLLERGRLFLVWFLGPIIALCTGCSAAIVARRSDWRISTLSVCALVAVLSLPTSLLTVVGTCLYVAASWLAMRVVSSWWRPSLPGTAVPLSQK
jgi:hypothetical protein